MFTGLIEACVPVRALERRGTGARLRLAAPARSAGEGGAEPWRVVPGESIAVSGVCLTVAGYGDPAGGAELPPPPAGTPGPPGADLLFDLSAETLARTGLGALAPGDRVNLERSLQLGDRLGGHLVSGHVDGRGRIVAIEDSGDGGRLVTFEVEPPFERYLVEKGSVTVDGISLTVVEPEGRRFGVAVIPATLELTTLGSAEVGARVNLEADAIGKWVERLLAPHLPGRDD